jgi:hypothetical protein
MKCYWTDKCAECKGPGMPYMLQNSIWTKITNKKERRLCLFCVEKRLNRKLKYSDFISAPINKGCFGFDIKDWFAGKYTRQNLKKISNYFKTL